MRLHKNPGFSGTIRGFRVGPLSPG